MSELLPDLIAWIIDHGYAVDEGDDIFWNFIPDVPDEVIVLYEYDSVMSPIKSSKTALRFVQVTYRASQDSVAKNGCDLLFKLFMNLGREGTPEEDDEDGIVILPSGRWAVIKPRQVPFKIEIDEQLRHIWGFNVGITTNPD